MPLSILELDKSAKNAKAKSAPGADGFSNKFIHKFWKYFRQPLFKLAQNCLKQGILQTTLKEQTLNLYQKREI